MGAYAALDASYSIDGAFPDVQAAHSLGTNALPYHETPWDMQAFDLITDNKMEIVRPPVGAAFQRLVILLLLLRDIQILVIVLLYYIQVFINVYQPIYNLI